MKNKTKDRALHEYENLQKVGTLPSEMDENAMVHVYKWDEKEIHVVRHVAKDSLTFVIKNKGLQTLSFCLSTEACYVLGQAIATAMLNKHIELSKDVTFEPITSTKGE